MKDVTKIISERGRRFLPVDMKDRLKSAFNRNSGTPALVNEPAEDVPDYGAIFNTSKAGNHQKNPRVAGPLDQTQLAEPTTSVTMRNASRQIGHDIEEAEIMEDVSAEQTSPKWESASLKTSRKADAHQASEALTPVEVASDAPDYSAVFKSSKHKNAESNAASRRIDPSSPQPTVESKVEERRTTFAAGLRPPSPRPGPKLDADSESPAPTHEEPAAKPTPRFFAKDFGLTESVRLKVEKREERPAIEAEATSATMRTPEPVTSESRPGWKAGSEEHRTAVHAEKVRPVEPPKEPPPAVAESVAIRTAIFEQSNINLQKENASMDAKGHESDNGAAARTEGGSVAAIAIERNSKFSGQLKFSGAIAIDGQVEGELVAERVVVHEGGVVNATVEGNTVVIAGNVKGDVYARNELEILPSGVVHGSVTAPAINVRRGGRVEGRCAIGVPRQ